MARVLLLGGTGLIGQALGQELVRQGYGVATLTRGAAPEAFSYPCQIISWQGSAASLPEGALDGVDAVINLAGESIAEGRWTAEKKLRLRSSRLGPTRALVQAISARADKPRVLIQGSAIGYYGDRGDAELREEEQPGRDFLSHLCVDWEDLTKPLAAQSVRVVLLRTGVVLASGGGALPKLAKLYNLGLGAAPGSGAQWLSWIHLTDLVGMIMAALTNERYRGPLNGTAPAPVPFVALHRELTGRSTGPVLRAPVPMMRLALGEAATMVLASQRVLPTKAVALGFSFRFPTLAAALGELLGSGRLRHASWLYAAQWMPAPLSEVALFFSDAQNLEDLTPSWLKFRIRDMSTPEIGEGTRIRYRLRLHGVPLAWTTNIADWDPPYGFVDEQEHGPFTLWHHSHRFSELGGGTLMTDLVRYKAPLGKLGALTAGWMVERDVQRIFAYRREIIARRFGTVVTGRGAQV